MQTNAMKLFKEFRLTKKKAQILTEKINSTKTELVGWTGQLADLENEAAAMVPQLTCCLENVKLRIEQIRLNLSQTQNEVSLCFAWLPRVMSILSFPF